MNGHRNSGTYRPIPRLLGVIAVVAGLVVISTTATDVRRASAAAIDIGTLGATLSDHVGVGNGTAGNCITYSPEGTGATTTVVVSPNEALTAHGYSSKCPSKLSTATQSAVGVRPSNVASVTDGTEFLLAGITHYNNPITANDSHFTGDLGIQLTGFTGSPTVVFPWTIWETPNNQSNCPGPLTSANGCDDQITFTDQISSTTVTKGGVTYRLVVTGFVPSATTACPPSASGAVETNWWTTEGSNTNACLYAMLVQVRNVTIVKHIVGATGVATAPSTAFAYTASGLLLGSPWSGKTFSLTPPANGSASTSTATEIVRGDTATIVETDPNDDRWAVTGVACTDFDVNGVARALPTVATYSLVARSITLANVPAPANTAFPDITCTFTNTYTPRATLTLAKVIAGGSATLADFTLTATGAPGAPVNGAVMSGVSGSGAVTSQRLVAGTYTLSEAGPAGYGSDVGWVCTGASVVGTTLTLGDGATATCTITNTFRTGSLRIEKQLDAPGGAVTNPSKTYSGTYTCGSASPVAFSVTPSAPFTASGIPAGAECTVSESAPVGDLLNGSYAWATPTYSSQPVTIVNGQTATVTITNHVVQATGTFSLVKSIDGLGGYIAGTSRVFPVTYTCTLAGAPPMTGVINISTAGTTSPSSSLPASSVCTFSEALVDHVGDFADASYHWTTSVVTPSSITVVAGSPVAVTVTNSYARSYGSLHVVKAIEGNGYLGGSGANFAVDYDCGGAFAGSVLLASGAPGVTISGLPAGATCSLSEAVPNESLLADAFDWGVPSWSTDNVPVIVADHAITRTVTNSTVPVYGTISVTKRLSGAVSGVVVGTLFDVSVTCPSVGTYVLHLVPGLTQSTPSLPVGTSCDVSETAPTVGLVDSSYAWGATPGPQHAVVAVKNTTTHVEVTNSISRVFGGLSISKHLTAPAGVVTTGRTFVGDYSCTYGTDMPVAGSWELAAGETFVVPSHTILLGSVCDVTERSTSIANPPSATDPSYVWTVLPAPQRVVVTLATPQPTVVVTNAVSRVTGSFAVTKVVAGTAATVGYVAGSSFPFNYVCAPAVDGDFVSGAFALVDGATWMGPQVPAGASCTVTEGTNPAPATVDYQWDGLHYTGSVSVLQTERAGTFTTPLDGTPVVVEAVNHLSRITGSIAVTKSVVGQTAGLVAGTAFTVNLVCTDQVARSVQLHDSGSFTFEGIPVGVTCHASETQPTASLLDASYAWGTPTYAPTTDVAIDGSIAVRNPIVRVTSAVALTKAFTGPQGVVPADRVYTGSWSCSYRRAVVASGAWAVTEGQTVNLATGVPLTAVCSANEDVLGPPSADPSYRWLAPIVTPVTVSSEVNLVTVTNRLTRDTGTITVSKLLAGATSGYVGSGAAFTVRWVCGVDGVPSIAPNSGAQTVAANSSVVLDGVPFGWTCALAEDSPSSQLLADASYSWGAATFDSSVVLVDASQPDQHAAVTNHIERVYGTLDITKSVVDAFGAVSPDATFTGAYQCTYGNDPTLSGAWTITGVAGGITSPNASFLVGSVCTVSEATPRASDLRDGSYAWNAPTFGPPAIIVGGTAVSATITNSVRRLYGGLTLTKQIVDPANGVSPTALFSLAWSCSAPGSGVLSGRLQLGAGETRTVFSPDDAVLPAGYTCSVVEDTPDPAMLVDGSFAWATPIYTPASVDVLDGATVGLSVSNSVRRVTSSLRITKQISGAASDLVDPLRSYVGVVTCVYGADAAVTLPWSATVTTPAMVDGILVGSNCTATESAAATDVPPVLGDPSYVWGVASVNPTSTVVAAPGSAVSTLAVVNPTQRNMGAFSVRKLVTGAVEGVVGATPTYHFTYECTPSIGTAVHGAFQLLAGGEWTSATDIPVGSSCVVAEPRDAMPTLADSAWAWDLPTFVVAGASSVPSTNGVTFVMPVGGPSLVTVDATNNVTRSYGAFTIAKNSTPASGSTVLPGSTVTYTLTVHSTGSVPVHGVVVTDNLSDVAPHAVIGPVFAADQGVAVFDAATSQLTWTVGDVPSGATVTLSYTATIAVDARNVVIKNAIVATADVPPTPCAQAETLCATQHYTPMWTVGKASTPSSGTTVVPGDLITYTITAINLSDTATADGIVVTDNLSSVLASATMVTDLESIGAHLVGTTLTWNANSLAPGASATLSYQVRVNAQALGVVLVNSMTATGATPPNQCSVTSESTQGCMTTHRTPLAPTITKSMVGVPVSTDGGVSYATTYQLVVTNPNASDEVQYSLADTLAFPLGVSISSATVTSAPLGVSVNPAWNGVGATALAVDVTLPAESSHTYVVKVVSVTPPTVLDELRTCSGLPSFGYFNTGTLVSFGITTAVSACVDVAAEAVSPPTVPTTTEVHSLPGTGGNVDGVTVLGAIAIGVGLMLLVVRRRRPIR